MTCYSPLVISFLGRTNFCASGYAQLCWLSCVIQSDMLKLYHSLANLFCSFHLSFSAWHQLQLLSQLQQSSPCDFLFLMLSSLQMLHLIIVFFYFQGFLDSLLYLGQVLYARFILPYKNYRLLC